MLGRRAVINGNVKGKAGERELAAFLRKHGFEARRGQQHAGGTDSPDVVTSIAGVHFECKRVEIGNPYVWLAQAIKDCGLKMPVVAHRRNREDWIAVMRLSDLLVLLGGVDEHGEETSDEPKVCSEREGTGA